MAGHLTGIYLHVVADVISNVREEFRNEGVDETVLQELQSLWELNMMQAGTIQGCHADMFTRGVVGGHPSTTSVHDLNMPYEGETPTAELLFPPTPVHTPLPTFAGSGSASEHLDTVNSSDIAIGRPAPFMQPSPWVHHRPDINIAMNPKLDMNVAYEGGDDEEPNNGNYLVTQEFLPTTVGKRKREDDSAAGSHFPQHDGAGDFLLASSSSEQAACGSEVASKAEGSMSTTMQKIDTNCSVRKPSLQQFDGGIDDNYDDVVAEEDYNEPGEEDVHTLEQVAVDSKDLQPSKSEGEEPEDSEPPLNEDDDLDELDGIDEGDEKFETDNVVYVQFEKVTRAKNKWKCILKDGIMHLNQRDYLFSRANGEFEF
ncbi:hypothetical protein GOP47_0020587 [Adiantum capillus-veneris]|uniref:Uncharacterized protein n=1 Tax=Adiantum capillus-veneris TaxID=13818 RepID=A0A9D4U9T1_ADICA|nr:hypothetical protein GOP47_0020587 [Adiantum capillus-veneris]